MKTETMSVKAIKRNWILMDASGVALGRLGTEISSFLRGKNKPMFSPNLDNGDYVVVINSDKVKLTGKKLEDKIYYYHTNYPGGIKGIPYKELMKKKSDFVVEKAVKGMLPKNRLSNQVFLKLKVYKGSEHKHIAQNPIKHEIKN